MRSKFFWSFFSILLICAVGAFLVDRYILYRQLFIQVDNRLETMATSIIASDLSPELLNNFEDTGDTLRSALEDQPLDFSIRIFNNQGKLLFENDMASSIEQPKSRDRWGFIQLGNRQLRILTLDTSEYSVEVGIFLQRLLTRTEDQLRYAGYILIAIILISVLIAYWISGFIMRPLNQLGTTFSTLKALGTTTEEFSHIREHQQLKLLEALGSERSEIGHLARELVAIFEHWQTLHESYRRDLFFLAHELKTPLAQIVLEIESVSEKFKDQKEFSSLQVVREICRTMAQFIDEYLRLASIRSTLRQKLNLVAIPAQKAIKELLALHFSTSQTRLQIRAAATLTVFAEPPHFNSAISNLVQNALTYSPGEVVVNIEADRIEVIDSGSGLSKETESRLGEAFNSSNSPGSTGLGLALVQGICTLYGWQLDYRHEENKTTFTISVGES